MRPEPKTERGRQTRNRLVEAAAELMREQGVEATSLDDVLVAASASKSQLYHYFDDKDHLVQAVTAYRTAETVRDYEAQLATVLVPAQFDAFLDRVLEDHARIHFRSGCPIASLAGELALRDRGSGADLGAAFAAIDAAFRAVFERFAAHGVLRSGVEPAVLATGVFALIEGGLLLAKVQGEGRPLEISLRTARDLVAAAVPSAAAA